LYPVLAGTLQLRGVLQLLESGFLYRLS